MAHRASQWAPRCTVIGEDGTTAQESCTAACGFTAEEASADGPAGRPCEVKQDPASVFCPRPRAVVGRVASTSRLRRGSSVDGSRRRRGSDLDRLWTGRGSGCPVDRQQTDASTPRLRFGSFVDGSQRRRGSDLDRPWTGRCDATAPIWIVCGRAAATPRLRFGSSVDRRVDAAALRSGTTQASKHARTPPCPSRVHARESSTIARGCWIPRGRDQTRSRRALRRQRGWLARTQPAISPQAVDRKPGDGHLPAE